MDASSIIPHWGARENGRNHDPATSKAFGVTRRERVASRPTRGDRRPVARATGRRTEGCTIDRGARETGETKESVSSGASMALEASFVPRVRTCWSGRPPATWPRRNKRLVAGRRGQLIAQKERTNFEIQMPRPIGFRARLFIIRDVRSGG